MPPASRCLKGVIGRRKETHGNDDPDEQRGLSRLPQPAPNDWLRKEQCSGELLQPRKTLNLPAGWRRFEKFAERKISSGHFQESRRGIPDTTPSNGTDAPQRTDFADGDKRVGSLLIHR